jgi:hypothetical protein
MKWIYPVYAQIKIQVGLSTITLDMIATGVVTLKFQLVVHLSSRYGDCLVLNLRKPITYKTFLLIWFVINSLFNCKIDYGELYERQRVRFGYPRIKGEKLVAMKNSIETLDQDHVRDLSYFSPNDIIDCIVFLESLFCPTWESSLRKKQRALIVALGFHNRIVTMQATKNVVGTDEYLEGYNDMEKHRTSYRIQRMVQCLCDSLGKGETFRRNVISYELLKSTIAETFWFGTSVDNVPADDLYDWITTLSKSKRN